MMRRAAQVMCRAAMARPAAAPMDSMHRTVAAQVSATPLLKSACSRALEEDYSAGGSRVARGGRRRPGFDAPVGTSGIIC